MIRLTAVWAGVLMVAALVSGCVAGGLTPEATGLTCTDDLGCVEVGADEPIVIAAMMVLTGPVAFLGEDQIGGIEIALDDYGDILGHEVSLTKEDALCSAEGGQTAARKIAANPRIAGVLGTACSAAATAALPVISSAGLSMIASSNTSPTLTDSDREGGGVWQPGYYRTSPNDLFQGGLAAEFAFGELGARKVATIHDGSVYAVKLQEVMAGVFAELGGEVTYRGALNVGDTDMRSLLTEIAAGKPDVLFLPIFQPEGNLVVVQARETQGLEDVDLIAAGGLYTQDFPVNTGEAVVGMYLTAPLVQNERYTELLDKWGARHGGTPPGAYHAHVYDSTFMLLDAITAAAQTDDAGNLLIGRQAIRDHLNAIEGFDGITGQLSCSPTGDCGSGEALVVYQMEAETVTGTWPPPVVYRP